MGRENGRDALNLGELIEADIERIQRLGLRLTVERDFAGLVDVFRQWRPDLRDPVNPTFNPERRDIHPDSFWLRAIDRQGNVVGTDATAIVHGGDLIEMMRDGTLWYRPGCRPDDWGQIGEIRSRGTPVSGSFSHGGALFVDPAWRMHGLGRLLLSLNRLFALHQCALDWVTGFVLEDMATVSANRKLYRFPHGSADLVLQGFWPVTGARVRLYLLSASAPRIMKSINARRGAAAA